MPQPFHRFVFSVSRIFDITVHFGVTDCMDCVQLLADSGRKTAFLSQQIYLTEFCRLHFRTAVLLIEYAYQ